ncbi:IclR family transcriptional regulator [Kyrpidia spormannii]|uniref:IclR family transcriptional regulator n=3 Tax=Alicyclobacillaceae TaxID=186823 RepID=A0ACA8ZCV9_9BACL|nr:IclR family transcriptional regulator [Kyrpidia spormannii]CAB3395343.1 IclR family transcriptional regulator [Kyrpidia spormannii]
MVMEMASSGEDTVKSVDRALVILERVSRYKEGVGITELAAEVSMYKSTVHRLLTTLARRGYVEQDPETGRYKLGYAILDMASRLLGSLDLRREARPYLEELADYSHEVVHLVVLDHGEVVYIEKVEGDETIRMHSRVGARAPVHCTGVGKAILAYLPEEDVKSIVERHGLPAHTPYTITRWLDLRDELQRVKERGVAMDLEENELGIICVAAPIWDHTGRVCASLSISAPKMRMPEERIKDLADRVRRAGLAISARLGFPSAVASR